MTLKSVKVNPEMDNKIEEIKNIIAIEMNIENDFCDNRKRDRHFVNARHILSYILKRLYPKMSFGEIGFYSGKRDHASVMYSLKVVNDLMDTDKEMETLVGTILRKTINVPEIISTKISKLNMAICVIDKFLKTGKYSYFELDNKEVNYYLLINNYLWADDNTISKLISYYQDKGINIKYQKSTLLFHESNFI
jgi:hypothetical protein